MCHVPWPIHNTQYIFMFVRSRSAVLRFAFCVLRLPFSVLRFALRLCMDDCIGLMLMAWQVTVLPGSDFPKILPQTPKVALSEFEKKA